MKWLGWSLVVAIGVVGWSAWSAPVPVRYRLTIEIDTPQGVRSGSSVIETTSSEGTWGFSEARGIRSRVRGEAVFVDLGEGKNLIGLLASGPNAVQGNFARLPMLAFGAAGPKVAWNEQHKLKGTVSIPTSSLPPPVPNWAPIHILPTLATFADIKEPRTARFVNPTINDFTSAFGVGYSFRRATIEMVSIGSWPLYLLGFGGVPVTRDIEKRLPWWRNEGRPASVAFRAMRQGSLSGPSIEPERLFTTD